MNRRIPAACAGLFLFMLATGGCARTALAQEAGWQESFDDPHLPGWEHSPEAIVVDGILRIGPGNFAARMGGWADFDLTVKVRFSGPGETVILYREADRGGYALRILVSDMVLFREIRPDQQRELDRSAGWTPSEGAWMDFRITVQQGRHSIAVDGNEILSAEDPEPLDPGIIVFASHGERTTEVDEISLAILHSEGGGEPPVGSEGQTAVLPTATPEPTAAPNALQELWAEVTAGQGAPLETGVFAVNLLLSVVFSFLLSRVYIYWGSSLSNRRKFAANFMLVTVTTTFIILVVRSSVALSLGLVGALSIIRFRTAVKEPEELAYLFFAISLGIGLGDNQRLVTLLSFMVVVLLIGLARLLRQTQADINLHLTVSSREPGKIGMSRVREVLEKHCAKLRLIRYDENPDQAETSFVVEFRHISDLEQARASLRELSPEMEISFLDNKGIW